MTTQTSNVVIYAGPNGSGKSHLIDSLKEDGLDTVAGKMLMPEYVINPDVIAKNLPGKFDTTRERDQAAFDKAVELKSEAIEKGIPFAYETVMSHPSRLNEMLRIKESGYSLTVIFITTENADINVARVEQRVLTNSTTGHPVAEEDIRDRYERTLTLLPKAVEISDQTFVYDNSVDDQQPKIQAFVDKENFEVAPDAKSWVKERLVDPLQAREVDYQNLSQAIDAEKQPFIDANALRGEYSGPVILKTKHYVAQYDEATKTTIIHDRLMLDTAKDKNPTPARYVDGEKLTVKYSIHNAAEVTHHDRTRTTEAKDASSAVERLKAATSPLRPLAKGGDKDR